ncbi:MAG: biotin/lipoyl-containing protein [Bacteroidales bacterium]
MTPGRFIVEHRQETRTVEVSSRGEVVVEGREAPLSVTAIDDHAYQVDADSRRTRVFAAAAGETREVFVDGRVFRFDVVGANDRRRAAAGGHGDQPMAPMPGTVVKLLVAVGEHVERGQILLKLEAMKMELPIRASHAGTIAAVHCREGELVQAGARLLDIEGP